MTRYAIVTNGVVRVITRADHLWLQANPNAVEVTDPYVGPGWLYDGQTFSRPPDLPPPVPTEVTMTQFRLALRRAGKYGQIQAALNQLPEPDKTDAQIEWEYSSVLQRNHPLVATLGGALGLDDAALDALFIQASTL